MFSLLKNGICVHLVSFFIFIAGYYPSVIIADSFSSEIINHGEIVKIGETSILYLNFENSTGLAEGAQVMVVSPTTADGGETTLAQAEIIKTVKNIAVAKIINRSAEIKVGDKAIIYSSYSAPKDNVISILKTPDELVVYPELATGGEAVDCPYGEFNGRKVSPIKTIKKGEVINILDVVDCLNFAGYFAKSKLRTASLAILNL